MFGVKESVEESMKKLLGENHVFLWFVIVFCRPADKTLDYHVDIMLQRAVSMFGDWSI